jgi:putative intracellular protease/amidase
MLFLSAYLVKKRPNMISEKVTVGNDKIFILIAPGFEEGPTIYCLAHLREAGLPVSLVSRTSGAVRGQHGLMILPDQTLAQTMSVKPRMVLIPGGRQCLAALAADPRVHELLKATLCNKGYIAAALKRHSLLTSDGFNLFMESSNFIPQEEQPIEAFANQLLVLTQVYS